MSVNMKCDIVERFSPPSVEVRITLPLPPLPLLPLFAAAFSEVLSFFVSPPVPQGLVCVSSYDVCSCRSVAMAFTLCAVGTARCIPSSLPVNICHMFHCLYLIGNTPVNVSIVYVLVHTCYLSPSIHRFGMLVFVTNQ